MEAKFLEKHTPGKQRLEAIAHLIDGLVGHAAE